MGCSPGKAKSCNLLIVRNTGQKYDGYWKDGTQHGVGKMISKDGSSRQGRWEAGQNAEWFNSTGTTNNNAQNSGLNQANPSPQNTGQNTPNFAGPVNQQNQVNNNQNQGGQGSNYNQPQTGNKNQSGFQGR